MGAKMTGPVHGHLSDEEAFDAVDGGLASDRLPHLASCSACEMRVRELQEVLAIVQDVEVPEPSPLFWDHLSARVAAALREPSAEPLGGAPAVLSWRPFWRFAVPCSAAVAALVMAVALTRPPRATGEGTSGRSSRAGIGATADGESDAAWVGVSGISDPLEFVASMLPDTEDAPEISAQSDVFGGGDSVDRALAELSNEEQRDLVDLLRKELGGRGA